MPEQKTKPGNESVDAFLEAVDEERREDCYAVLKLMQKVTGEKPKLWGSQMVGFGNYHYKYDSGHEGDWFLTGFSPRKQNLTLYIMPGFAEYANMMKKLGKYKTGKSCLYVKKLEDIDTKILKQLVEESVDWMLKKTKQGKYKAGK